MQPQQIDHLFVVFEICLQLYQQPSTPQFNHKYNHKMSQHKKKKIKNIKI